MFEQLIQRVRIININREMLLHASSRNKYFGKMKSKRKRYIGLWIRLAVGASGSSSSNKLKRSLFQFVRPSAAVVATCQWTGVGVRGEGFEGSGEWRKDSIVI